MLYMVELFSDGAIVSLEVFETKEAAEEWRLKNGGRGTVSYLSKAEADKTYTDSDKFDEEFDLDWAV